MHTTFRTAAVIALLLIAATPTPAQEAPAQEAAALTSEQLKAIAAKPHDDNLTLKELEILPNVREWNATGHFIDAKGAREPFKGKTTSKRVDGKYEVSQTLFEGHAVSLTMITTYDPKTNAFYKYTLPPRGPASKSVGLRIPNTNSIAWATVGAGPEMITIETYGENKMTWHSLMLDKSGRVTLTTEGEATFARQ